MAPLHGTRVLDLTNVLAGPFCTHQLAHLGAEVIKVEAPGRGDLARQLGASPKLNARGMGVSFLAQNAGKQSITLNLKHPRGKALLKQLVAGADVLVENFRAGVMQRLGLDFEVLSELNDQLVYCAISGFGQDGPLRHQPAYDQIVQGMSGVMSITGDNNSAPLRVGYPLCDTLGGMTAAMAICAALNGRAQNGGSFIDVSMLEATLASMGWVISNWLIAGVEPQANGNENMTSAPSGTFCAQDGPFNIAANKQKQWELLCNHVERPDLINNPDYADREQRKRNRDQLRTELETMLRRRPAREWVAELNRLGVPAGEVLSVPAALTQTQVASRGMLHTFSNVPGAECDATVVRTGFKVNGEPPQVSSPPPVLGQHNAEVFASLGVDETELQRLISEGIV